MLTSTEPWEEFLPTVTERFFIRYSNSRPSSRATADPDTPLTAIFLIRTALGVDLPLQSGCRRIKGAAAARVLEAGGEFQNLDGGQSNQKMEIKKKMWRITPAAPNPPAATERKRTEHNPPNKQRGRGHSDRQRHTPMRNGMV